MWIAVAKGSGQVAKKRRAAVPEEVSGVVVARRTAFISYLSVVGRRARRNTEEVVETGLGVAMRRGSIQKGIEGASQALEVP